MLIYHQIIIMQRPSYARHVQRPPDTKPSTKPSEGRKFDDDGFKEVVPETGHSLMSSCNAIGKSLGSGDKVLSYINSLITSIRGWEDEQEAANISIPEDVQADIKQFEVIQSKLIKLSTDVRKLAQTIRHDIIDDHTTQFFRPEFIILIEGIVDTEYSPPHLRIYDLWIKDEYARFSTAYGQLIDKATNSWNFEYDATDDAERIRISTNGIDRLITPYAMNQFKADITVIESTIRAIGHIIRNASMIQDIKKCTDMVGTGCRFTRFTDARRLMLQLIKKIIALIPSMNWNQMHEGVRHITNIRNIYDYYLQYDTTQEDILERRDTYMKWLTDLVAAQRKRNREDLEKEVRSVSAQICNELGWGRV
jgi:hypothetical protein